jgi:pimeloyl-ACP methyl ester carboxylesterase
MEAVADATMGRWFTSDFASPLVERIGADLRATNPAAYASCCEAIGHMDLRPALARITAPTLVIAGSEDRSTLAAHGHAIAQAITGAHFEVVRAAHISNVEAAADVTPLLLAHLWA